MEGIDAAFTADSYQPGALIVGLCKLLYEKVRERWHWRWGRAQRHTHSHTHTHACTNTHCPAWMSPSPCIYMCLCAGVGLWDGWWRLCAPV